MLEAASKRLKAVLDGSQELTGVDAIIVSGDITYQGNERGLEQFRDVLVPSLSRLVGGSKERIYVVPGNHDVAWGLDDKLKDYHGDRYSSFLNMMQASGVAGPLVPKGPKDKLMWRQRSRDSAGLHVDDNRKLVVLCVNSALRCGERQTHKLSKLLASTAVLQEEKFLPDNANARDSYRATLSALEEQMKSHAVADIAHVGDTQLDVLQGQLQALKKKNGTACDEYLRIATLHHHLVEPPSAPLEIKAFERVIDSSRLLSLLEEYGFDLVLSGHKHFAYEHSVPGCPRLTAIGSPTVAGDVPPGESSGFRVIDVGSNKELLTGVFSLSSPPRHIDKTIRQCLTPSRSIESSGAFGPGIYHAPFGEGRVTTKATVRIYTVSPDGLFTGRAWTADDGQFWAIHGTSRGDFLVGHYIDEHQSLDQDGMGTFMLTKENDLGDYKGHWSGHDSVHQVPTKGSYNWRKELNVEFLTVDKCRGRPFKTTLDLLQNTLGTYISKNTVKEAAESEGGALLTATIEGNKVAGVILVRCLSKIENKKYSEKSGVKLSGKVGFIQHMAVHPKFRSRGVGGRLLKAGLEHLAGESCKQVFGIVWQPKRKDANTSLGIFRGQGFSETKPVSRYWAKGGKKEIGYCKECATGCSCSAVFVSRRVSTS